MDLLYLLFFYNLQYISYAFAYENAGHEAVAMTAMSGLSSSANEALRSLLHGHDIGDISGWPHRVSKKYPDTNALHFQSNPSCKVDESGKVESIDLETCREADKHCLLKSILYFYSRLIDPTMSRVSELSDLIDISKFSFPHGLKLTEADSLKYLVNLIGDLHQPLHLGGPSDDFGRRLYVEYTTVHGQKVASLYDFLEKGFIDKIMEERQYFWSSGWTHINSIKSAYETERFDFETHKERSFMRWANETRTLLCSEIYPLIRSLSTNDDSRKAHIIDKTAEFLLFDILKRRLLIAGARLSIVLNHILKSRSEKGYATLTEGSGIRDVHDAPEVFNPQGIENNSFQNFLINLSIFLVVFVLFVIISKCFYSMPSQAQEEGGEKMREMKNS